LRKNLRQIRGWAKSSGATNYRVYDADLPDFAFALDVYHDAVAPDTPYVCLQEYRAPAHIDTRLAQSRIDSAAEVVLQELGCQRHHLAIKRRDRQRGDQQYNRLEKLNEFHQVIEGDSRLLINIHDYLDCGVFLDHRKVRLWLAKNASGKRLLNLYCYTATATVHAAVGGASSSVSVDLSYKYLEWAEKNFALNNLDTARHKLVRADSRAWIDTHIKSGDEGFDIIFLDPPTFSNSSATEQDWEVQRDHESMIEQCMSILNPSGVLVFSNNFRRFRLSAKIAERFTVEDRTKWSLQRDFSRNPKIHQCWFIKH
jgi:23S rRNA (guanine2445-N2)-methyltransferase / 23S rRNA (guanine2069-N7)-methyltransferase